MAKAFNEKEKEHITKLLIEKGSELFSTYGLRKTSIADLTAAAGIAQGTFYGFYESKEELYFEIIEHEETILQSKLIDETLITEKLTKGKLQQFLQKAFELIDENKILKRLLVGEDYELLIRKLPVEKLEKHKQKDEEKLLPLITHWQSRGEMIDRNPDEIMGMLRGFFTFTLHKKEIGEKEYKGAVQLLIELIANGLVIERGEKND